MLAKLLGAWVAVAIVSVAPARAADPPPIFVGGQFIRQHAVQDAGGHLLVPVRGVFEALHASVTYTPPRIVVVRKNGGVIAGLVVGRNHAVVANRPRLLPAAPIRLAGRVYVPLRVIAEIAGASVVYSARPRLVDIRLPYNELPAPAPVRLAALIPPDPTVPAWAYVLVGVCVVGFLIEFARRLALAGPRLPKRRSAAAALPLPPHALQLPHAVGSRDQHGIGKIAK